MASSGGGAGGGKAQQQPQGLLPEDRVPWEEKLGACVYMCVSVCLVMLVVWGVNQGDVTE